MSSVPPVHNMALSNFSAMSAETLPPRRRRAEHIERTINLVPASLYDILGSAAKCPARPNKGIVFFNFPTASNITPSEAMFFLLQLIE